MFKNMKSLLLGLVVLSFMVGCAGGHPRPSHKPKQPPISADAKKVYISSKAIYNGPIAQNIKSECRIDSQVMTWIKKYSAKKNIDVIIDGKPKENDTVLKIDIIDAMSAGNAAVGHNKYVVISGKLYEGKKLKSSFKAARRSGGGYFVGAYRSSCSVLGSCAKTLGRDTSSWLVNPVNNEKIGDTYLIK